MFLVRRRLSGRLVYRFSLDGFEVGMNDRHVLRQVVPSHLLPHDSSTPTPESF